MIDQVRTAVKASWSETLRPRVVQQQIIRWTPAEVGAALEAFVGDIEVLCAQIITKGHVTSTRRWPITVAAKASD